MENPITSIRLNDITNIVYILKMFLMGLCTFYIFSRILNQKLKFNIKFIILIIFIFVITVLHTILKYDYFTSMIFFLISLSVLYAFITSNTIGNCILVTLCSFSLNYIIYIASVSIGFFPNVILDIQNDTISLTIIYMIHFILLFSLFKIQKFKHGIAFFKENLRNEYFDILILNISVVILFSSIIISNYNLFLTTSLFFGLLTFAIIMFITIYKSLTIYYKHNLLVNDLNETKEELDKKNKEIEKLEKDNLEFSKTNHSIAHKQRALEYKLNELMLNTEFANELDISDSIKNFSKKYFNSSPVLELTKTEIAKIDDMLKFMQHECIMNNIDFELQLNGNIFHMINTFIPEENLEILLADHIKNSIISINNSDNINRSILVRLGLIDNYYSLYVYDSGIEFEPYTLANLGKMPITTYSDTGGTGLGFMKTFDTLKKCNASLIINELNPPCKDNYTKSIVIKFDNKHEFKINSYRLNSVSNN